MTAFHYEKQKVWEALQCLVSPKLFTERLTAAAGPLSQLMHLHPRLIDKWPEPVKSKFYNVMNLVSEHSPRWDGDSGAAASVARLTPRQRAKVAKDILEIYVEMTGGL